MKRLFRDLLLATALVAFGNLVTANAQTCGVTDIVTVRGTTTVGPTYDLNNLAAIGFSIALDGTVQFEYSHEYNPLLQVLTSDGFIKVRSYDAAGNLVDTLDIVPARVTYNEFNETSNNGFFFDTYRAGGVSSVNGKVFGFGIGMDDTTDRNALPNPPSVYLNDLSLWSYATGGINTDLNDDGQIEVGYFGPIVSLSASVIPRCSTPAAVSSYVNGLSPSAFNSHGQKNAMLARLENIRQRILAGDTAGALLELRTLRRKVDGCGNSADNDDWITDCVAQTQVRAMIDQIITSLGG